MKRFFVIVLLVAAPVQLVAQTPNITDAVTNDMQVAGDLTLGPDGTVSAVVLTFNGSGATTTISHAPSSGVLTVDNDIHMGSNKLIVEDGTYISSSGDGNIHCYTNAARAWYSNTTGTFFDTNLQATGHTTFGNGTEDYTISNGDKWYFNGLMQFKQNVDIASGNVFEFESIAAAEMTDDNGAQSMVFIKPEVDQDGASGASYTILELDSEETGLSDGQNYILTGAANGTPKVAIETDGDITTVGDITSSDTGDIGWSVVAGADTACNTTCTSACVFGFDDDATTIVDCTSAAADKCVCAGGS